MEQSARPLGGTLLVVSRCAPINGLASWSTQAATFASSREYYPQNLENLAVFCYYAVSRYRRNHCRRNCFPNIFEPEGNLPMRYSAAPFRASSILAGIALAGATLSGCGKLFPPGQAETLNLLKSGSERVCVDPNVQATLRKSILPDLSALQPAGNADQQKALDAIAFTYSATSMTSFDKATSNATCDSVLEVHAPDNTSSTFHITYTVSPSAEATSDIVVTAMAGDARSYIVNLANGALDALSAQAAAMNEMEGDDQPAAPQVDEAALVGVWIKTGQAGATCRAGSSVVFQQDHVLSGGLGSGRWALTGNTLHIVTDAKRTADVSANIVAADAISFTLSMPGNSVLKLRRCSNEDLQAPPSQPSMDENMSGAL